MNNHKIRVVEAANDIMQSSFYNRWKSNHFVTSVLCFAPGGTIPVYFDNIPRGFHDSTVPNWGGFYNKLKFIVSEGI
jgi:hypothetical protein